MSNELKPTIPPEVLERAAAAVGRKARALSGYRGWDYSALIAEAALEAAHMESAGLSGFLAYDDDHPVNPKRFVYYATCDRAWDYERAVVLPWRRGWPTVIDLSKVPASAIVRRGEQSSPDAGRSTTATGVQMPIPGQAAAGGGSPLPRQAPQPETGGSEAQTVEAEPRAAGESPALDPEEDTPCCGENRSRAADPDTVKAALRRGTGGVSTAENKAKTEKAPSQPAACGDLAQPITPENQQAEKAETDQADGVSKAEPVDDSDDPRKPQPPADLFFCRQIQWSVDWDHIFDASSVDRAIVELYTEAMRAREAEYRLRAEIAELRKPVELPPLTVCRQTAYEHGFSDFREIVVAFEALARGR